MYRKLFLLALIILTNFSFAQALYTTEANPSKKTKVFLLAGQSNMDGRGDASKLTLQDQKALRFAQKSINFYYKGSVNNSKDAWVIDGVLNTTDPPNFIKKKFRLETCFGPELFFGTELAKHYPDEKFLFIKRAQGGTSLYGAWNANWTLEKARTTNEENKPKLYQDFIATVDAQLAKLPFESYEIVGMLWVQGESDSGNKNGPLPTETYEANITALIQKVRSHYQIDNLPFLMLGVGSNKVVKSMESASQKLPNVTLIKRSLNPDGINYTPRYTHKWNGKPANHYNYIGMKKIGQLFFENYNKFYSHYIRN